MSDMVTVVSEGSGGRSFSLQIANDDTIASALAEHPPVQFSQKHMFEDVALARLGPLKSRADIDLLGFVQLVPQRQVGRDELALLLRG